WRGAGQSPFCFVLATMLRWSIDVGGALPVSARKAVHTSFFDVERIRADPRTAPVPRFESIEIATALPVPNITCPPGGTLNDVAVASLSAPPPAPPKTSIPTCIGAVSVEVQEKYVAQPAITVPPTPDTE